uniref:Kielin cysteine rich BMP regulator n=1 Tax=Erpetoichthys calabaricus TaxID=27687 RepID=A0A8C4SRN7_ERPCA
MDGCYCSLLPLCHNSTVFEFPLQNTDLLARVKYLETCECRRPQCSWEGRNYDDGSRWEKDQCTACTCVNGQVQCSVNEKCTGKFQQCFCLITTTLILATFVDLTPGKLGDVTCETTQCNDVPCGNPVKRPGECCPVCEGYYCIFQYMHFELFSQNGNVNCIKQECIPTSCQHPIIPRNKCCPECFGCFYNGHRLRNGQSFQADQCTRCTCRNGSVQCETLTCPELPCLNHYLPPGECFCILDGVEFEEGAEWEPDEDACSICTCSNGEVICQVSQCPPLSCQHPSKSNKGDCCASCDSCMYNQRIYNNGQDFIDPDSPCQNCRCQDGTVQCIPNNCPRLHCSNPDIKSGQCCPRCPDCTFENRVFVDGEKFPNPLNPCQECICVNGHVNCENRDCPGAVCTYPMPGTCCRNNCNGCSFAGKDYVNGAEYPHPTDKCKVCHCINGNVQCFPRRCPPLLCSNPFIMPGECCPQCPAPPAECFYSGLPYKHMERFYDPVDKCRSCICNNGTITCQRKPCAPVLCTHPIVQDCCRTCDGCLYGGKEMANGEQFTDTSDPCRLCVCREGTVSCDRRSCPILDCPFPVQAQCCPACEGCNYAGQEYLNGQEFTDPQNQCKRCTCINGFVTCNPKPCYNPGCTHPISLPGKCCPVCEGCFFNGITIANGETFSDPSDSCSLCTCRKGEVTLVTCQRKPCREQCTHPVPSSSCCPVCDRCFLDGTEFGNRQTFLSPSDSCQRCNCLNGNVVCTGVICPQTTCTSPHTIPGQCCPECLGCVYNLREYLDGSSWFASTTPCMSCMCVEGVTTCSEIHCVLPCVNQIHVPGECCPVCADCVYNNHVYGPHESFQPADDPCEICTCEHLRCYRKQCPSLVDCPKSHIHFPSPDQCCPTCKKLNCRCPHLSCPSSEQFTPADSCCPICDDPNTSCIYQSTTYQSNEHWEVDECTTCTCVSGEVHCQTERCPQVTCASDETAALIPGMCCPHCIPRPATCIAFGDPHYRTFDGKMINFQGTCTYVLAEDCEGGDFSIHTTNDDKGRKGVSWIKEVTVLIGDVVVQLLQDWIVLVDYQTVTLPFLKEPYIYVERKTNTILLNTNIGHFILQVLWNGKSHLEVSVPGTYKGHTCGLCGNFNNYPQDDMRIRTGQIVLSEAAFGNNWKVKNVTNVQCADGDDVDPCKEAGYRARKEGNSKCKILKSKVFERCHSVVPPEMFFASCVYDLCACGSNVDDCLCDALEAYASECREAGVILHWRSPSLCAVGCPQDRGYVFDECGPPCPKTCFNKDVPLGVIEAHCFKPCIPGCQCPAGLVEHESHCILPESCPRIIYGNI